MAYKTVACNLSELLSKESENGFPFSLYWIFSTTSNVFSIASDLYVATKDIEKFGDWLIENGMSLEAIERAFE